MNVPADLALEAFRESGNLPFAKFPATMALAEIIGKMLDLNRDERPAYQKPAISYSPRRGNAAR
jgi:hypothetical protein